LLIYGSLKIVVLSRKLGAKVRRGEQISPGELKTKQFIKNLATQNFSKKSEASIIVINGANENSAFMVAQS
jgi:hypothetical protein